MKFTDKIVGWYQKNKRDLPWRKSKDPYEIWIAEVVFQQTRIEQGLPYYIRIINRFPTIYDLADANEQDILKLWQGLGYYTRARNMHHTAKRIVSEFRGKFPDTYQQIIELKGIGPYTAAAILSTAFGKPFPLVDGNVTRVLARIFGIRADIHSAMGKSKFLQKAEELIDTKNPGDFNQAVMEFGALFCLPRNPDCENCIFSKDCYAFKNNKVQELPLKNPAKLLRKRYFHYFIFHGRSHTLDFVFLNKRTGNDIWRHLYDFPNIETDKPVGIKKLEQLFYEKFRMRADLSKAFENEYQHTLTHRKITGKFYKIDLQNTSGHEKFKRIFGREYTQVAKNEIDVYPVSRLVEKYLQEHF